MRELDLYYGERRVNRALGSIQPGTNGNGKHLPYLRYVVSPEASPTRPSHAESNTFANAYHSGLRVSSLATWWMSMLPPQFMGFRTEALVDGNSACPIVL